MVGIEVRTLLLSCYRLRALGTVSRKARMLQGAVASTVRLPLVLNGNEKVLSNWGPYLPKALLLAVDIDPTFSRYDNLSAAPWFLRSQTHMMHQ